VAILFGDSALITSLSKTLNILQLLITYKLQINWFASANKRSSLVHSFLMVYSFPRMIKTGRQDSAISFDTDCGETCRVWKYQLLSTDGVEELPGGLAVHLYDDPSVLIPHLIILL
jgi:hypothetical protein